MDRLTTLVDQAIEAFDSRRRTGWSATTRPLTNDDQELQRWQPLVEARLKRFRHSGVDRANLLARVQERYRGVEWTADIQGVGDELQDLARRELQEHLTDNGVPLAAAERIVQCYSIRG